MSETRNRKLDSFSKPTLENFESVVLALSKVADTFEAGAQEIRSILKDSISTFGDYNTENLVWEQKTGEKGQYEMTRYDGTQNFTNLRDYIDRHDGRCEINGQFYWLFTGGDAIGRKRRVNQ